MSEFVNEKTVKMGSIKTHLTVALLLCILLPTGLIGGTAYWFVYNDIRENRIGDVGLIADARHEELRVWLHENNERSKALLDSLIAACRHSDAGINACARAKLEQFFTINHAVGLTFHSGIESDLAMGADAIPFDKLNQPFLPGQIATTSTSKVNGASLLSLIAADSASGFSLVTTYPGQQLQDIFVDSPVLGQSGETFLADSQGLFVTKPRYPSQQGVVPSITAVTMERCLHSENSEILDFDYRNVHVIHGFRFVPEIGGGCIMAHIDQAEAFAPLKQLVMGLGVAAFLFACSAWLSAMIIGRSMAKPIIALTDMARALSRGDFTPRVSSASYHEIAELSQLFNNMAGQLDNTISWLKVSEQELEKKVVELDKRHRKYHSVIRTTEDGFWRIDREGRLLEVNPAYVRLSGYAEMELLGMRVTGLEAQETPEETVEHIRKVMRQGSDTFETRHRRKDGSVWDVEVNASFISEDGGYFVGFFRDITKRKLMEDELKASEAKLRSIIDVCPVPLVLHDEQLNITFLNQSFKQTFGYTLDDIPTLAEWRLKAYPDPDYRQRIRATWEAALKKAKQEQTDFPPMELDILCKNNGTKIVLATAATIHQDFGGEYLLVLYDITRRKQIEAKLNAIFNASVEGIITADMSDTILSANAAVETIFGYKPEELVGWNIHKLMSSSPKEMNDCSLASAEKLATQIQETEGIHKNGSVVPLDLSIAKFSIDNAQYFTYIVRDVSLRKYREQADKKHLDELAHVTRLGLMGEMASGIAHEVNQPLAAISSYTQVSLNLINTDHPDLVKLAEILSKTQQQALRAGRIIHRMRDFVKSHAKQRSSVDVNSLIHDCVDLCSADIKQHDIRLTLELENKLPPIDVDQIQIEQVLINLIRNSIDVLQNLPAKQQRQLIIHSCLTPDSILVKVKDNGPGIDQEQRQKILTPFYTTKAEGMGMGLSISCSLIEAHEGRLYFNSMPGKGTTFYFTLPITPIKSEER